MATPTKTNQPIEFIPGVDFVSKADARRMFEQQARKLFGMSSEEFIRRYRADEIEDPSSSNVTFLAMMIPFAED